MFIIGGGISAKGLKVSKVNIKLTSTALRHMKEDGTTIVDARILKPTTITVETFCPDLNTQEQVDKILKDRGNYYLIQSKGLSFSMMLLDHERISQTANMLSAAPVSLSFKQVIMPVIDVASHPADSDLINRGMTAINKVTTSVTDLYSKVSSTISSIL
jgi:hypothetical protein